MQRYQRQVNEERTPAAFGRNFTDGAATGVQVGGAIAGIGDTINRFAEIRQRQQDEWDAATVMNAQVEYARQMTDWMDNPETGKTQTLKLGAAKGLTDQTFSYADDVAVKIAAGLENEAQKKAFLHIAERAKLPYWKQASEHEAGQMRAYKEQAFKASLEAWEAAVLRAPGDAFTFETTIKQRANTIRAYLSGAAPEVINQAVAASTSELEAARIAVVSEDNPLLGEQLVKNSPYLVPQDAMKLRAALAPKAEIYKTQAFVDEMVQKFGPDNESEGIDWIRKNHGGPDEEKYVSAYKQRIGEMTVNEVNVDTALRKQQEANFEQLYKDTWGQGQNPPQEKLDSMLQNNMISAKQHRQGMRLSQVAAERAQVTKNLAKDPGWTSLSPQQQEEKVMRRMGITKEQRDAVLSEIKSGILDGTITNAEIEAYWKNGTITSSEKERYKAMDAQISKEQKTFVSDQRKALSVDMDTIKIPGKDDKIFKELAQGKFSELVGQLDPNSKTYRKDVMDVRREAIVYAVGASGEKLKDSTWFGFGDNDIQPTSLGVRRNKVLSDLEEQTGKIQEYTPSFQTDAIDLTPEPVAQGTGNIGLDMVGGKGRISGKFDDWRSYSGRNGQHNGIDVAVPEGTPIVSPDVGAPLRVKSIQLRNKIAGNYVIAEGRLPDGRPIEMQVSHMKNGSIPLKVGDVIAPGDIIGQVGNTGMTSDRVKGGITPWYAGKKSGHHMDLKIKIDGEYVNPEKVQLGPTREAAAIMNGKKPSIDEFFAGRVKGFGDK